MLARERMTVETDADNIPFVHIPSSELWDFVEFMTSHRHPVVYDYRDDAFYVQFSRLSSEQAQEMVDEFANQDTPLLVAV